jgi:hypothetical protein
VVPQHQRVATALREEAALDARRGRRIDVALERFVDDDVDQGFGARDSTWRVSTASSTSN